MTNKANKGFVFSAYDKFFCFLLMDNHLFLSIYVGILFHLFLNSIIDAPFLARFNSILVPTSVVNWFFVKFTGFFTTFSYYDNQKRSSTVSNTAP